MVGPLLYKAGMSTPANTVEITGGITWRYDRGVTVKMALSISPKPSAQRWMTPRATYLTLSDAVLTDRGGNAALNGATVIEITAAGSPLITTVIFLLRERFCGCGDNRKRYYR